MTKEGIAFCVSFHAFRKVPGQRRTAWPRHLVAPGGEAVARGVEGGWTGEWTESGRRVAFHWL